MSLFPPLRAEMYRFRKTRATWVLLVLPALFGAARILGAHAADRLKRAQEIAAGLDSPASLESIAESGFGPLADGLRTGGAVLTLLLLILGAMQLVRERETGALGLAFLARSRGAVVVGKAFSLLLFTLCAFLLLFLVSAGIAAGLNGLGPVVDEGFEMASAAELWADTARGSLSCLPALFAAGLFGLFISALASTPATAVAGTLVPFLAFDVLGGLFEEFSRRVFVTYTPFLGGGSPLVRLTEIARAFSDAGWAEGELSRAVWVPGLEGLLLLLLAVLVTRLRPA
ncbi:MAG: ABC transporter permease subunit [Planctomycetota bacterium]